MPEFQALVDKALKTAAEALDEHYSLDTRLHAAEIVLRFAASVSRGAPEAPAGCQHENRIDMTTMGSAVVKEICRQCGAELEDGVVVKG